MNENRVMIYIVYDRAIDEEVIDTLEEIGLHFYTKWKDVVGVGVHDPHLGDNIWPGLNNVVMIATDTGMKENLFSRVKDLQRRFTSVGLRAFVVPLLDML